MWIMGSSFSSNENQNDIVYGTTINGQALGDIMGQRSNETFLRMPKPLQSGDKMGVTCTLKNNPEKVTIAFLTETRDYNNIAYEVEANFIEDKLVCRIIRNGTAHKIFEDKASNYHPIEDAKFKLELDILSNEDILVTIGNNALDSHALNFNNIAFISLSDDILNVNDLNFTFSNTNFI